MEPRTALPAGDQPHGTLDVGRDWRVRLAASPLGLVLLVGGGQLLVAAARRFSPAVKPGATRTPATAAGAAPPIRFFWPSTI